MNNTHARASRDAGISLLHAGYLGKALENLTTAYRLQPGDTSTRDSLDRACDKAWSSLSSDATTISPNERVDYLNALLRIADLFMENAELRKANTIYTRLAVYFPDHPGLTYKLADSFKYLGDLDNALTCFRKALSLQPDFTAATAGVASVYEKQGNYQMAAEILADRLREHGENPLIALAYGKVCKYTGDFRDGLYRVTRALQSCRAQKENLLQLHFLAGSLHEALGEYDRAFDHYQTANRLKECHFDRGAFEKQIDRLSGVFNRETLDRMPHASRTGCRMVFIVGMMRSGTSLTEQILASHPAVHAAGELRHLGDVTLDFRKLFTGGLFSRETAVTVEQHHLDRLAQQYLEELGTLPRNILLATDKMPSNYLRLQMVELLFPDARIIQCVRDPLDTCLSCYFNDFIGVHNYAYDLVDLGAYYKGYERLMEHWKQELQVPIMQLSYEDLVTNPEKVIPELLAFCDLDWDDRCLRFFGNDRFVNTRSYDQVRQPLYTGSIGRWKNFRSRISPLITELGI